MRGHGGREATDAALALLAAEETPRLATGKRAVLTRDGVQRNAKAWWIAGEGLTSASAAEVRWPRLPANTRKCGGMRACKALSAALSGWRVRLRECGGRDALHLVDREETTTRREMV